MQESTFCLLNWAELPLEGRPPAFLDRPKVGTDPYASDNLKLSRVTEAGNIVQAYAQVEWPNLHLAIESL